MNNPSIPNNKTNNSNPNKPTNYKQPTSHTPTTKHHNQLNIYQEDINKINITTNNVNGLKDQLKILEIINEIQEKNIKIYGISESHLNENEINQIKHTLKNHN